MAQFFNCAYGYEHDQPLQPRRFRAPISTAFDSATSNWPLECVARFIQTVSSHRVDVQLRYLGTFGTFVIELDLHFCRVFRRFRTPISTGFDSTTSIWPLECVSLFFLKIHSRFHHKRCELTRAWLNLLTEHAIPGRINQICILKPKQGLDRFRIVGNGLRSKSLQINGFRWNRCKSTDFVEILANQRISLKS